MQGEVIAYRALDPESKVQFQVQTKARRRFWISMKLSQELPSLWGHARASGESPNGAPW